MTKTSIRTLATMSVVIANFRRIGTNDSFACRAVIAENANRAREML
jgi:hypothetical protein